METQIEKARTTIIDDTNVRILTFKTLDYSYGVYINTICKDLKNDSIEIRNELLELLKDFTTNVNSDLRRYINGDSATKYEASISMSNTVSRLSTKIHNSYNKQSGLFTNVKVRCVVGSLRHLLELKEFKKSEL